MSYLFGFSGRINRAKIWLFILVAIVWWVVIALIAVFGLHWSQFGAVIRDFKAAAPHVAHPPLPWPDPVSGTGWIAVAAIALLALGYVWAKLAIFVKRLHDRNKSAWWLIPYWVVPTALYVYVRVSECPHMGRLFVNGGPLQKIALGVALLIGLWVFVELYFFRGTTGENRYGPDPLA